MSYKDALSIIDGKLETLFDTLDLEIYNGDLTEGEVRKALAVYGLEAVWDEYLDYE